MFTASCSVDVTQGPNGEVLCSGTLSSIDGSAAPNLDPLVIAQAWGSGFSIASIPLLGALVLGVILRSIKSL